jgi:tripeptide aminopeptidase
MKLGLLKELYMTHSPSRKEGKMIELVKTKLLMMNIPFQMDEYGQIYNINEGAPLLVHHMDQVQSTKCDKVLAIKNRLYGFTAKGKLSGLGADDKNGIFVALNMIEKFREEVSFIFTVCEEIGGRLQELTPLLNLTPEIAPYALIFDRKGNGDIIGSSNNYCCEDLEVAIEVIGREHGYTPNRGIFSDADELSKWIPCVNLSVGYYNAHTSEEYTKPSELWNAMRLAETLIINLPKKGAPYELPEKVQYAQTWDNWDDGHYGWDAQGYPIELRANHKYTVSTSKSKKHKKTKDSVPVDEALRIRENCSLSIDYGMGIHFYTPDLEEVFIADTYHECFGTWNIEDAEAPDGKGKLHIKEDLTVVKAFYRGIQISVEEFHEDGTYDQLSGPKVSV